MRVGTSALRVHSVDTWQDHPHACGDKFGTNRGRFIREGSSPCVWGQGKLIRSCSVLAGIIPMRVGTSLKTVVQDGKY